MKKTTASVLAVIVTLAFGSTAFGSSAVPKELKEKFQTKATCLTCHTTMKVTKADLKLNELGEKVNKDAVKPAAAADQKAVYDYAKVNELVKAAAPK